MSWIAATDPLALLAIQAGSVPTPGAAAAVAGQQGLTGDQRSVVLGEPVPIVFARRRDGAGGVLISPGASEARFENDGANQVTASYHLVLSEGQIDSVQVRDVFGGPCRVGSFSQTYNRRAGTWTPENVIVARPGYELPIASYYCGTVGAYPDISTLSYQVTAPNGSDEWKRQVHVFVRGGMRVTRLYDATLGPSDNLADLAQWLLLNSERVPSGLIDTARLTTVATFLEANGFRCNIEISEATSYDQFIAGVAPYFLLAESNVNGQRGLRPLLPTTAGAINTGVMTWEYRFDEDTVIPGSLEINYTTLADRQPFVAQMQWRQQLESDFAIIRTAAVRYDDTAESGPYESHDLTAFCTSEDHAVKVGAYILSKRVNTSHTIRFRARPEKHLQLLNPGDVCRVVLQRKAAGRSPSKIDNLYQIERVSKSLAGEATYEASFIPLDDQGRSIVALDVAAAVGSGILLPSNRTGLSCDVNSASDTTVPAETSRDAGSETETIESGPGQQPSYISGGEQLINLPIGSDPGDTTDYLDRQGSSLTRSTGSNGEAYLEIPSTCTSGEEPRKIEWEYAKAGSSTFNKLPGAHGRMIPITRVPHGASVTGTADISTPGAQYRAAWYCPEPGQTDPEDAITDANLRYSNAYTVTPADLEPWERSGALAIVSGFTGWWYRQDAGGGSSTWDTQYQPYVGGEFFAYHNVWAANATPPGLILGYNNYAFDYVTPSNNVANQKNIAQGPSVVGFYIGSFYAGLASDLPSGGSGMPPGWTPKVSRATAPPFFYW
ncbi:MAG: hypothetical protein ACO3FA_00840 [Vulcanococcus sp.]